MDSLAACARKRGSSAALSLEFRISLVSIRSINEVICHGWLSLLTLRCFLCLSSLEGIPDLRPLVEGDIINLDVTIYYNGFVFSTGRHFTLRLSVLCSYHGDVNATYFVGEVDEDSKHLVRTARRCLDEAIRMCKPGA
jgi:methionine aminopeptidase